MSEERVGVLLRLPKALLERADQRRGAMKRNPWLVEVIEAHLDGLDASDVARDPGRQFGSHAHRFGVRDEDGSDLGLVASRRDDGVLDLELPDALGGEGNGGPLAGAAPGVGPADLGESGGADTGSPSFPATEIGEIP